jgi:hypothetical protein
MSYRHDGRLISYNATAAIGTRGNFGVSAATELQKYT